MEIVTKASDFIVRVIGTITCLLILYGAIFGGSIHVHLNSPFKWFK